MHLQQIDRWPNTLREETAALRQEIAAHLQRYTGNLTNIVTPFRGVMMAELHEPTPPMSYIYEPSLSLIIQGEKRVSFGDMLLHLQRVAFFPHRRQLAYRCRSPVRQRRSPVYVIATPAKFAAGSGSDCRYGAAWQPH